MFCERWSKSQLNWRFTVSRMGVWKLNLKVVKKHDLVYITHVIGNRNIIVGKQFINKKRATQQGQKENIVGRSKKEN